MFATSKKEQLLYEKVSAVLTFVGVVAFFFLLLFVCNKSWQNALILCLSSAVAFFLITILRKVLDVSRPNIKDTIYSKKSGESFPSRHAYSMFFIAFLWIKYSIVLGIILTLIGVVMSIARVKIGAHRPIDVVFGGIFAFLFALIINIFV